MQSVAANRPRMKVAVVNDLYVYTERIWLIVLSGNAGGLADCS